MTIEQIIEGEKDQLRGGLYEMFDQPLSGGDDTIRELFQSYWPEESLMDLQLNHIDTIRDALESAEIQAYFLMSPLKAEDTNYTIWLPMEELEVPEDIIEPEEKEEVTIIGEMAYIYLGYGLIFEYNPEKIKETLEEE